MITSKYQWVLTKLGMCIDIVEIWFGIANGQISSIFDSYLPATCQYFTFWMIILVSIYGFSPDLVCVLPLWRSGLGLLMGNFRQFFTELSVRDTSIFLFQDNNLSKSQLLFTQLDMRIDIVEIWFRIVIWYISSILDWIISPWYDNGGGIIISRFYF